MKNGVKVLVLAVFALLLESCRTVKPVGAINEVPVETKIKVVERLVPVVNPADSANVQALFACNEKNQVIMTALTEEKSRRVQSYFSYADGKLNYSTKTKPEVVYLVAKDSIIYQQVPIHINVPVEVNKITWWQNTQIIGGRMLFALLVIYLVYIGFRTKFNIFK